ncbi:MAG: hypothetical protein AAFY88_05450, partial [Acidobacteriota bacterium]
MSRIVDPETWRELQQHYDRVVDLPSQDRSGYIGDLRRTEPKLAESLASLIAASDDAERRIRSVLDRNLDALCEANDGPSMPKRIGPYEVLRELGRGGMSVVYLARRADRHFRKKVAIKVVLRGM